MSNPEALAEMKEIIANAREAADDVRRLLVVDNILCRFPGQENAEIACQRAVETSGLS